MTRFCIRNGLLLTVLLVQACGSKTGTEPVSTRLLPAIAGAGSAEPHLARTPNGDIVMSWLEPEGDRMALRVSTLSGDAWQTPVTVASGENWFVNWADFPSVVPIDETLWAAHWLARTAGGVYSYDVAISLSNDAGRTWGEPLTPHDDGTPTEHGFVTLFPWSGAVGAIWLDGRNMAGRLHGETAEDSHGGGMTIRSAVIESDGSIRNPQIVDDLVCDCCQTDVSVTASGPVAVYRNRTDREIRDIHVVSSRDGEWLEDQPVADDGWKIAACPVNGPAIDSHRDTTAVAWFTAPEDDTKVRIAWSSDAGRSFAKPVDVDIDKPIGRVDVELLDDDSAIISWLRAGKDNRGEICLRHVRTSGAAGEVAVIATTGANRSSGFPQMIRQGRALVLAWTDTAGDTSRVVSARVDIQSLTQQ